MLRWRMHPHQHKEQLRPMKHSSRHREASRQSEAWLTTSSWMKLVSCLSSARRLANSFFVAPDPDPEPEPDPGSASSIVPVRACQRSAKIN